MRRSGLLPPGQVDFYHAPVLGITHPLDQVALFKIVQHQGDVAGGFEQLGAHFALQSGPRWYNVSRMPNCEESGLSIAPCDKGGPRRPFGGAVKLDELIERLDSFGLP